jgi:hypothetical protein
MMDETHTSSAAPLAESAVLDAAVKRAAYLAILKHARAGQMVADWQDGKVVWVPASEILARLSQDANGASQ